MLLYSNELVEKTQKNYYLKIVRINGPKNGPDPNIDVLNSNCTPYIWDLGSALGFDKN